VQGGKRKKKSECAKTNITDPENILVHLAKLSSLKSGRPNVFFKRTTAIFGS
jgi:hypothetical protein